MSNNFEKASGMIKNHEAYMSKTIHQEKHVKISQGMGKIHYLKRR